VTEVVIARLDVPAPTIDPGLKVAVAPAGKPLMLKATAPENPLRLLTVIP